MVDVKIIISTIEVHVVVFYFSPNLCELWSCDLQPTLLTTYITYNLHYLQFV